MTEVQSWDEIKNFQSISINDMFNLEDRAESRMDSCLLHTRRMPAITPSGDIYRCCYNAYSEGALMGNLTDVEACAQALQAVEAPRHCRAFDVAEVNQSCKRCPISKVSVV